MRQLTAFCNGALVASGDEAAVWAILHARDSMDHVLVFDDATGRGTDLDLRPGRAPRSDGDTSGSKGRGRPKLGVVAREVTLLPRHWDWLALQRGGASAALRRLIDAARRAEGETGGNVDAAYFAMSALAGNLPGFEEAARVLFAGDRDTFDRLTGAWPDDVINYVRRLAGW